MLNLIYVFGMHFDINAGDGGSDHQKYGRLPLPQQCTYRASF